jgi:hypothetical protein
MIRTLAAVKALSENVLWQIASDKDQTACFRLAGLPGALMISFEQHVNALNNETIGIVLEVKNALEAQNIGPELLGDLLYPRQELLGDERCVSRQ